MILVDIGKTAEGRTQTMAIITSPRTTRNSTTTSRSPAVGAGGGPERRRGAQAGGRREGRGLDRWRPPRHRSSRRAADCRDAYQMVSRTDAETLRFLNDVILLCVPPTRMAWTRVGLVHAQCRSGETIDRGDPKAVPEVRGHDNNRDSYMVNMPETENMNRVMFSEWFPQIMYNTTSPVRRGPWCSCRRSGIHSTTTSIRSFRSVSRPSHGMHSRFVPRQAWQHDAVRAGYSTWWNGGLRTTVYFHNMIGLLTEIIGNPTPMEIPFLPQKLVRRLTTRSRSCRRSAPQTVD